MRTDEEMQITLRTLQQDFGVDVAPAQGLSGADLATWLEQGSSQNSENKAR